MNEDSYESIAKECQINALQDVKLGRCGFAFEPERDEPEEEEPVQVTGITMVSPPESPPEYVEEEIFHTPPEHHQSRSVSSCDDLGPEIRPGNNQSGRECDGDDFVGDVVCDQEVRGVEVDLKGKKVDSKVSESEDVEIVKNLKGKKVDSKVIESEDVEIVENEAVDLSVEENCGNVVGNEKCESSRERLGRRNIEDLDAYRYVSSGGVGTSRGVTTRRELPNSFKEQEENEGLWVPRRSNRDTETFKGLVGAAGIVSAKSTDTDYIKAAKERGLEFYRPRWWPPEGFDD